MPPRDERLRQRADIPAFLVGNFLRALGGDALQQRFQVGSPGGGRTGKRGRKRRQDGRNPGDGSFGRDLGQLFGAPADDVLLLKIAWWFGR